MCMYVFEICAEGIVISFPWWLENVKSRSKIALFSNERHFEIWFPKKRTITFLWSKVSKLHKKDPILHVATTFSLKQGETRTSHGPIPHPLSLRKNKNNLSKCEEKMRKVQLLPTRDCEAGYGPDTALIQTARCAINNVWNGDANERK